MYLASVELKVTLVKLAVLFEIARVPVMLALSLGEKRPKPPAKYSLALISVAALLLAEPRFKVLSATVSVPEAALIRA